MRDQGLASGGGSGCPADMHPEGGYCVPNSPVGCSQAGAGALALLGLAVVVVRKRR